MSSILKALEKAEQSQTGRRSGGPSGLARSSKARPAWLLPAGILGGAAAAALVTFAAMGGFSGQAPVSQSQDAQQCASAPAGAVPQAAVNAAVAATPHVEGAAAPVAHSSKAPAPAPSVDPVAARMKTVLAAPAKTAKAEPAAAKVAAGRVTEQTAGKKGERDKPERVRELHHAEQSRPVPPRTAPLQAAPAPVAPPAVEKAPELRVTGIAWQNDSQSSVAIINGRSVQQGALVDGYKVEQIFEDKVRLSGKSGRLEIPLGAGEE